MFLLEESRRELVEACLGLGDVDMRIRPTAGEWCALEVLAHIPDVDRHYLHQALATRDQKQCVFQYFDDESWKATHSDVASLPLQRVLNKLKASHMEVLKAVEELESDDLVRAGVHPRRGRYTVREALLRMSDHDRNHARQIQAIREALSKR